MRGRGSYGLFGLNIFLAAEMILENKCDLSSPGLLGSDTV
jgi:hypothetical protein